jgi:FKBP-type peptidyl-prolyl cis-trans isomerase SlyD
MIIEINKIVSFTFDLRIANAAGESIQKVKKSRPMKIVYGRGNLFEPFEKRLAGLKTGDKFEFHIESKDAYGSYNDKAIATLEKSVFTENEMVDDDLLQVGNYIPMETESGIPFNGKIVEIAGDKVMIDFNHPLAGQDLFFKGEILDVRDATNSEIETCQVERKLRRQKKI